MKRRRVLTLISLAFASLWIVFSASNAVAQAAADMDGVKAASKAFYVALAALDGGAAMGKVWAHTPYVTYVAPVSKSVVVGWDAQEKMWPGDDKRVSKRNVTLSDQVIHVSGNFAWEMGQEGGEAQLKGSEPTKPDNLVTNVYEKIDGRWLMVSHHAQRKPQ
jgi:ketosteroid isomerase-like protein